MAWHWISDKLQLLPELLTSFQNRAGLPNNYGIYGLSVEHETHVSRHPWINQFGNDLKINMINMAIKEFGLDFDYCHWSFAPASAICQVVSECGGKVITIHGLWTLSMPVDVSPMVYKLCIQISWRKLHLTYSIWSIRSQQTFAQATTAMLSWHVQKLTVIWV